MSEWDQRAMLPGLRAVLDPAEAADGKNRLIAAAQEAALLRALGNLARARVLDFGCGNGRISRLLTDRGATVVGVDVSAGMVAAAAQAVPDASFHVVDRALPFPNRAFDVAVSVGVLQYTGDTIRDVVAEIARVAQRIVAIEQVHTIPADRGGPIDWYLDAFTAAGLQVTNRRIRNGPVFGNRLVDRAAYDPRLARLPFLPLLMRHASVPVGGYYDCLFVTSQESRPRS